jgi:hypothetical protein
VAPLTIRRVSSQPVKQRRGSYMDTQESIEMKALHDIPLGHKIALKDFAGMNPVIKYGPTSAGCRGDIKPANTFTHTI